MFKRGLVSLLLCGMLLVGCSEREVSTQEDTSNVSIEDTAEVTEETTENKQEIVEHYEKLVGVSESNTDALIEPTEEQVDKSPEEIEEQVIEVFNEQADDISVAASFEAITEKTVSEETIIVGEDNTSEETVKQDYNFPFDSTRDLSKPFLNTEPNKWVIVDVDMNTDVDDVCAVRMATALDDLGVIDLKAVCYCTDYSSYGALRGILHHDGKDDVLMGQGTEDRHEGSPYWNELGKHNDFGGNWESSVRQYRKVLAEATSPVDIVTTGQVTNLEALLKSEPDDISTLTGKELVMTKVGQLYIAGGDYPDGWSNNLALTNAATVATKYVTQNWELPIIWSPGNHSGKLTCGKYLQDLDVYRQDPVTRSLDAWGVSDGRAAWDPFAVWVCGYACGEANQVSLTRCTFGIQDGGANWFTEDPNGDNYVLDLTNTDLNYYNQIMDNHLIHIFTKTYGVENPNKEPIGYQIRQQEILV